MKTNVIMKRPMGNLIVEQRTVDGMFNATTLANQYVKNTGTDKRVKDFFRLKQTDEFIEVLMNEENKHWGNSPNGDNQVIKTVRGKYGVNGRSPDEVWMHPYLFIKFAMWLNPKFEYHVIKFVYDSLIELRKISADLYIELCNATNWYYINNRSREARMDEYRINGRLIQQLVFGKVFTANPWQQASEKQLQLRTNLQKILIGCYVNNYPLNKTQRLLESQVEIAELI